MLGSDNSSQPKIATINYNVMICMFIYTVSRFFDEIGFLHGQAQEGQGHCGMLVAVLLYQSQVRIAQVKNMGILGRLCLIQGLGLGKVDLIRGRPTCMFIDTIVMHVH